MEQFVATSTRRIGNRTSTVREVVLLSQRANVVFYRCSQRQIAQDVFSWLGVSLMKPISKVRGRVVIYSLTVHYACTA